MRWIGVDAVVVLTLTLLRFELGAAQSTCDITSGGHSLDLSNFSGNQLATTYMLSLYTPCTHTTNQIITSSTIFPCNTWQLYVPHTHTHTHTFALRPACERR
jgi:hypothetical protein